MEYAFRNTLTRFLLVLGILGLATSMLWGQAGTGELTGLVSDPSGAVVANATVNLSNSATGEKRTTVTTPAGIYRFSALPIVGTYTVELAPKGFKSTKISGIVISVGTVVTRDVKLELGATTEQVTVEAGAETVQTSESAVSQLVDRRIWQQMPLEVRNQNSFIELVAGAVPQDGSGNNRGAEVNGTRGGAGSYLVEGADNNEQGQAGRGQISPYDKGGAATSISPDAIQEYRVITNSYSAEYGKGGGFITDTVLKSGTNNWHGSAFEYNRIQALAANDWFSNHAGNKDSLVRNQFGGSIGGPIIKDKTFFYGTAELHRVRQQVPSAVVQSTTQQFLDFVNTGGLETWAETDPNGLCVQFTAATCPGAFANSAALGPIFNALKAKLPYPLATNPSTFSTTGKGLYTTGLTYPVPVYGLVTVPDPESFNEAKWTIKFDHRFSDKDQFSGVYLFQDGTFLDSIQGGNNLVGPPIIQDGRGQQLSLTWNHTFTPTLLNTFKASYLRHVLNFPAAPNTFGTPAYYTIDGSGVDLGSSPGLPQFFTDNQFQYVDTMSYVHGKHSFKFGGEYRRTRNGSAFFNDAFSSIFPWGVEDTLTDLNFTNDAEQFLFAGPPYYGAYYGAAYLATASLVPSTGAEPVFYRGYRANEFDGFVQDDWRVNNRLTVNLGVRWEYFGPPHNVTPNIDSNFFFGSTVTPTQQLCKNTVPGPQYVTCASLGITPNAFFPSSPFLSGVQNGSFQVRNNEIWNKDTNNFSPRLGFAWDVFGTQKLVMRAGVGLTYDRIYNNLFENIRFNPPFFSDNQIGVFINGSPTPIQALQYPLTTARQNVFNNPAFTPVPNPRHIDQNLVTPYYEQAHFGFQWEFLKGYVFEPQYIGTFGHKLTGISDINTYDGRRAAGQTSTRTNPLVGADNFRSNGYSSNYHALQLSVRKTYSAGLSFTANYTWSKTLDEISDAFNAKNNLRVTDNLNPHLDYGPADFDLRHRFVGTVSYDLPFMKNDRWFGGWGVNSIISYQTGFPFSPYDSRSGYDRNKDGYRSDRIVPLVPASRTILSGSAIDSCSAAAGGRCWFDTTQWIDYTCPASVNGGLWCNPPIGRNSIYGPHVFNMDLNVTKKFKITETSALSFQANFFNIFNHPNFQAPTTGANANDGTFGQSTLTLGDNGGHRITQLAVRFDF